MPSRHVEISEPIHRLDMSASSKQGSYSVHYGFTQRFNFPAKDAYDWSMDYRTDDIQRMGKRGTRAIKRVNEDTLVVTDTFLLGRGRRVTKRRLIRMYPELLTMVNTRLSADGLHSQFIYRFLDEGEGRSRLEFNGAQVFYGDKPSPLKLASIAKELAEEDAAIWVRLTSEMERDLRRSTRSTTSKVSG